MNLQPKSRMTVDEFFVWADGREDKWELVDGEVVAMSPERVRHAETKLATAIALRTAVQTAGLSCRVLVDGVAVRIDQRTSYVPDALVYCGEPVDPEKMEVLEPVIVVEVVSPSSTSIDTGRKLSGYFRLPSIMHYLIIDPAASIVIHHWRSEGGTIQARILGSSRLDLHPPGLSVDVAAFFADT